MKKESQRVCSSERELDPIFEFHDPNRRRLGKITCVNFRINRERYVS